MKKPALTLLLLTLSTLLFAQKESMFLSTSMGITEVPTAYDAAVTDQENDLDYVQQDLAAATLTGEISPKRHGVPNKAYSVRGGVSYTTGNGIRLSNQEVGFSVKHFFKSNEALEVILSTGWHYTGSRLTGLYERQQPLGSNGFYWYWGIGGHAGLFKGNYWTGEDNCLEGRYQSHGQWYSCDSQRFTLGIDGIAGLEYHFAEAPFTISLDLKPSLDLLSLSPQYGEGALCVRYAF